MPNNTDFNNTNSLDNSYQSNTYLGGEEGIYLNTSTNQTPNFDTEETYNPISESPEGMSYLNYDTSESDSADNEDISIGYREGTKQYDSSNIVENAATRARQQQVEKRNNLIKNLQFMATPWVAENSVENLSDNPAIIQDTYRTAWDNWFTSFRDKVRELQKTREQGKYIEADQKVGKLERLLDNNPNILREQYEKYQADLNTARYERDQYVDEIEDREEAIAGVDLPYELRQKAAQADEGTGNPFIASDYGIGTYLRNELPADLGGSYFDWPAKLGLAVGPRVMSTVGAKAAASLGAAGPVGAAVGTITYLASLAVSAGLTYRMRENESYAEMADAYKSKVAQKAKEFQEAKDRQPTKEEMRDIEINAHDGIEDVKNANMSMLLEDYVQIGMLAMPWTKGIDILKMGRAGNIGEGLFKAGLATTTQGIMEGIEESNQYIWQEEYKDGTLDEITDLKSAASNYADTSLRSFWAVLGVGEKELMESSEWGNSVRAGVVLGGGTAAANSIAANTRDILSTKRIKNQAETLLQRDSEHEKENYRNALIGKFMNGASSVRLSNLFGDVKRAADQGLSLSDIVYKGNKINDLKDKLEEIKGSKFAQENNITTDEINEEIKSIDDAIRIRKVIDRDKNLQDLTDQEKEQATKTLMNLEREKRKSRKKKNENRSKYDKLKYDFSSDYEHKGTEFTDLLETKLQLEAVREQSNNLKKLNDKGISNGRFVVSQLQMAHTAKLKELEKQYNEKLKESEFSEKDLTSTYDEDMKQAYGEWYSAQNDENIHAAKFEQLLNNTNELVKQTKAFIREDKKANKDVDGSVDQQINEEYTEDTFGENEAATEPIYLQDSNGNRYVYNHEQENGRYKIKNVDSGTVNLFTKEQAQEKGLTRVDESQISEDFKSQAEQDTDNEIQERKNEINLKISEPGVQDAKEQTETKREHLNYKLRLQKLQEYKELYGDELTGNLTPSELFEEKKLQYIGAIFDGRSGILFVEEESNQVIFQDVDGNEYYISGYNSPLSMNEMGITPLKFNMFDIGVVADGRTFNIVGSYFNNMFENPYEAIMEDGYGNPQYVVLEDYQRNQVTFQNPALVNELASAIALIEETKEEILETYKQGGEDFVIIESPEGIEYAVYNKLGKLIVRRQDGYVGIKRFNTYISRDMQEKVKRYYNNEIQKHFNNVINYVSQSDRIKNREEITNAIRELDSSIRGATAAEINASKSAAEIPTPKREKRQTRTEETQPQARRETGEQAEELEEQPQEASKTNPEIDTLASNLSNPKSDNVSSVNVNIESTERNGMTIYTLTFNEVVKSGNNTNFKTYDTFNSLHSELERLGFTEEGLALADQILEQMPDEAARLESMVIYPEGSGTNSYADISVPRIGSGGRINLEYKYSPEATSSKSEEGMVDDKSQQLAEEKVQGEQQEPSTKVSPSNYLELSNEEIESMKTPHERGLSDASSTLSYYGEKEAAENPTGYLGDLDRYLSNPAHSLSVHHVEFEIDWEYTPFWNGVQATEEFKKDLAKSNLSDEEINSIIDKHIADSFDSKLDNLPIKAILKDDQGNVVGKLNFHRSSYDNILIPESIKNIQEKSERLKKTADHIRKERQKIRDKRLYIIRDLLKGNKPKITKLNKDKGKEVNAHKDETNRNKKLTEVFTDTKPSEFTIGVADNNGVIITNKKKQLAGLSKSPGNVFLQTDRTATGENAVVKLNPTKLSKEHARILFQAMIQAYTGGGYDQIYSGFEVNGITVGEVITLLTREGKKYTKVDTEKGKGLRHLIPKQLYTEDGKLYFGDKSMNLKSIDKYTADEINQFVNWAVANKNYSVIMSRLGGSPFQKNIKIGSIKINKGDTYTEHLVKNGILRTDLRKPYFRTPLVTFDFESYTANEEPTKQEVEGSTVQETQKPEPAQEDENYEEKYPPKKGNKSRTFYRVYNEERFKNLPAGTELVTLSSVYDSETNQKQGTNFTPYFRVEEENGKKVLRLVSHEGRMGQKFGEYDGRPIDSDEMAREIVNHFNSNSYEKGIGYIYYKDHGETDKSARDINTRSPFRLKSYASNNYKKIDIDKEVKWLKKKLPKEKVHVIDDLINVARSGDQAFGLVRKDSIILSKSAEVGTAYHEAFHRVSLSLLTPEQRQAVYSEARKKYGLENYKDKAVEEFLAERFRNYMVNLERTEIKEPNVILRFFIKIRDFIQTLFTRGDVNLKTVDIESLFEKIRSGGFKFARTNTNKTSWILDSTNYLSEVKGYTPDQQRTITKNIVYLAFDINGIKDLDSIENLNFNVVQDELASYRDQYGDKRDELYDEYDNILDEEEANQMLKEVEEAERLHLLYSDIVENFDKFQNLAEEYLASLNIIKNEEDPTEIEYEKGGGISGFEKYNKASFEFDSRKNVRSEIKMMIMTLPMSRERDSFTNMYEFVDFTSTWNKVMNDFHSVNSVEEMMERLQNKSKYNIPYQVLYKRLSESNELLKTQFYNSVKKAKHNFVNAFFNDKNGRYTFSFGTAEVESAANQYTAEWGQRFEDSEYVDKKGNIDKQKIDDLLNRYNKVKKDVVQYNRTGSIENYSEVVDEIVSMLNDIKIPLDKDNIEYILDKDESASGRDEALKDFVLDDINNLFSKESTLYRASRGDYPQRGDYTYTNAELFKNEKVVRDVLAQSYVEYNPDKLSPVVLGPQGNPYYVYADNSYMTDVIDKINRDTEHLELLKTTPFNNNSYIINKLLSDSSLRTRFSVDTFSSFVRDYFDRGRSYVDINKIEDFLFKAHAIQHNKLPLPTLADRKAYMMYSGIDTISAGIVINNDGSTSIPQGSEAVDIVMGYIQDERDRIQHVKDQVDEALETGESSHLVEDYHYKLAYSVKSGQEYLKMGDGLYKILKEKDDKGNMKYTGSGTEYHYFTDLNEKSVSDSQLRRYATKVLGSIINDTISLADDFNVVDKTFDKKKNISRISNKLLDSELVSQIAEERYNGDTNAAAKKILADYAVNTMISNIETDKILLMDPAYYKTTENKVKRSTVLSSSGENLRVDYPAGHEFSGQTTYNGIVLDSSIIESVYYPQLLEKFKEYYINERGYNENKAERIARDKLEGYKKVDQTDAQVYISPEMYRSIRKRLGEWTEQDQQAYEALQEGDFDNVADLQLQPLKTMYFGVHFSNGNAIPVYDKMSMAVLHRQAVKGTELEHLLDRMELKGDYAPGARLNRKGNLSKVHQAAFDTAKKAAKQDRVKYYADNEHTELNNLDEVSVYPQKFEYLRRQNITDPHDETRTMLASQVKKVPMANVDPNRTYTVNGDPMQGDKVLEEINNVLGRLSTMGKDKMLKEIGFNTETMSLEEPSKLVNILRQDSIKSNSTNNIIEALNTDENGEIYPFDVMPDADWIERRIVSMFNKRVIDIKMPGGSFIQMSNFGLRKMYDRKLENYKDKVTWLQEATDELKFYRTSGEKTDKVDYGQEDIEVMETIVSTRLFKDVIPNYRSVSFEQAKEFLKNNPEIMGYRIPTQGTNSVSKLKVVGFLPENYGDTIVLPAEFTTLTGSDFDIDKLYVARYNYGLDENNNPYKIEYKDNRNSTLDERIRNYAYEALSEEIDDIHKTYVREIKNLTRKKNITKQELNYLKDQIKVYERYYDVVRIDEAKEEASNTQDRIDAIHAFLDDTNAGIDTFKQMIDEDINSIVEDWISKNRDEFAQRPMIEQNTSQALENRLLDSYFSILTNSEHVVQTTTPLDAYTGILEVISEEVREGQQEEQSPYRSLTPRFNTEIKERYTGGSRGIGPFALNNVHHILGQIADLHIAENLGIRQEKKEKGKYDHYLPMNFKDGDGGRKMKDSFSGQSTMDLILEGNRTATSRSPQAYKDVKKGDLIKFRDKEGREVLVRAVTDNYAIEEITPEEWSNLEGWDTSVYNKIKDKGYKQFQFEKVEDEDYGYTPLGKTLDRDGEYILDWMSALISAHVDIAKDPYIFDLNVNGYTYNMTNFLIRAGLGKSTFHFLSQPILKELANLDSYTSKSDVGISGFDGKPLPYIRKKYSNLYNQRLAEEQKEGRELKDTTGKPFNSNRLRDDARLSTNKDSQYYARQLEILDKFEEMSYYADALNDALMASRIDTKKYGKNLAEIKNYMNKFDQVFDYDVIQNFDQLFNKTFVGQYMDNVIPNIRRVLDGQVLAATEEFNVLHDQIIMNSKAKYTSSNKKILNVVNKGSKELRSAILGRFFTNPRYLGVSKQKAKSLLYGDNTMAKRIYDLKVSEKVHNNKLIDNLKPRFGKGNDPDIVTLNDLDIQEKWDKDEVTRGWKELLTSSDESLRKIGEDLVTYSFFTSGFNRNIYSFFQFIPTSYLINIGYSDYIKQAKKTLDEAGNADLLMNLIDEVYKNNIDNDDLVPKIKGSHIKHTIKAKNNFNVLFSTNDNAFDTNIIGYNFKGEPIFRRYVKREQGGNQYLYEYIGYRTNTGNEYSGVYRYINRLGYNNKGRVIREFNFGSSMLGLNNRELVNMDKLTKDNIGSNVRNDNKNFNYGDFVPIDKEDMTIDTYVGENKDKSMYTTENSMNIQEKITFKRMKINGQKNFTVQEIQNAYPQLSQEEAKVIRDMIAEGRINNNC